VTAKEIKRAGFQERKTALIFSYTNFYRTPIILFLPSYVRNNNLKFERLDTMD
jgi:hypothetical protein